MGTIEKLFTDYCKVLEFEKKDFVDNILKSFDTDNPKLAILKNMLYDLEEDEAVPKEVSELIDKIKISIKELELK